MRLAGIIETVGPHLAMEHPIAIAIPTLASAVPKIKFNAFHPGRRKGIIGALRRGSGHARTAISAERLHANLGPGFVGVIVQASGNFVVPEPFFKPIAPVVDIAFIGSVIDAWNCEYFVRPLGYSLRDGKHGEGKAERVGI